MNQEIEREATPKVKPAELSEQDLEKVAGGGASASGGTTVGSVTVTPSGGKPKGTSTTTPQSQNTTFGA